MLWDTNVTEILVTAFGDYAGSIYFIKWDITTQTQTRTLDKIQQSGDIMSINTHNPLAWWKVRNNALLDFNQY